MKTNIVRIGDYVAVFGKKKETLAPKIQFGPLSLFQQNYLAAWHWGWSLTWRWIFKIKRHDKACLNWTLRLKGRLIGFNTPLIDVWLHMQENMEREKKGKV